MSQYARSLLEQGHHTFQCPHIDESGNVRCTRVWEWFMVRHVAALSDDEMLDFERLLGISEFSSLYAPCKPRNPHDHMQNTFETLTPIFVYCHFDACFSGELRAQSDGYAAVPRLQEFLHQAEQERQNRPLPHLQEDHREGL